MLIPLNEGGKLSFVYLLLKSLAKLISAINSETAPSQLAAGIAFGAIIGLSPFFAWHNLIIVFLVALLRVNLAMFFWSVALFSLLGFVLDPVFDGFGYWLLVDFQMARSLWLWIATAPILPYFRLNNTIVIGSLIFSLLLFIPLFGSSRFLIQRYRRLWKEKIANSRLVKALKATKLYELYQKAKSLQGKWERLS